MIDDIIKQTRRFVIFVIGITILLVGVAMIILPGPAIIVIPVALAILATEFVWAKRLLHRMKNELDGAKTKLGFGKKDGKDAKGAGPTPIESEDSKPAESETSKQVDSTTQPEKKEELKSG